MTIYRAAIHTGKPIELYVPGRQWLREPHIIPQYLARDYNRYLLDVEARDEEEALIKVNIEWALYCHNNFINKEPLTYREKRSRLKAIVTALNTGSTIYIAEMRCHIYVSPNGQRKIICNHEVCPTTFDPSYEIWVSQKLFIQGMWKYIRSEEDWPTYKIIQQFGPFTGSTLNIF